MKRHINFTCKTAFFKLRHMSTIQHYLSVDSTKILLVSLVLSRIDYCNFLSAGLALSLISKLQRILKCAARLVVRASSSVHVTPILRQLHWLSVRTRISYKIARLCFNAINLPYFFLFFLFFLISCTYTLPLDLFSPVLTPAS